MKKYAIFTDGSIFDKFNIGGWAYIVCEHKDKSFIEINKGQGKIKELYTDNIFICESEALLNSLIAIKELFKNSSERIKITFYIDNLSVVRLLKGEKDSSFNSCVSTWKDIFKLIYSSELKNIFLEYRHVNSHMEKKGLKTAKLKLIDLAVKEKNEFVDLLAKQASRDTRIK